MKEKIMEQIRHSHRHTHEAPDNHRQVVDTALYNWCERQFPDNPSRCDGLKNVTFTKIQETTYKGKDYLIFMMNY